MIFAELIYKQNHSTPKIIPHHATKKPSETIVPEGTLLANMKLSYPRQKVLATAWTGEVVLDVQPVRRGGGSKKQNDGTIFGTLGAFGKSQFFDPRQRIGWCSRRDCYPPECIRCQDSGTDIAFH